MKNSNMSTTETFLTRTYQTENEMNCSRNCSHKSYRHLCVYAVWHSTILWCDTIKVKQCIIHRRHLETVIIKIYPAAIKIQSLKAI